MGETFKRLWGQINVMVQEDSRWENKKTKFAKKLLPVTKVNLKKIIFFWLYDFCTGQQTSFMFILRYEAGFYKPTIFKVHLPISRVTAYATMPSRLEHSIIFFAPHCWSKWKSVCKMVSSVGGLNPQPISHESSALTTRY